MIKANNNINQNNVEKNEQENNNRFSYPKFSINSENNGNNNNNNNIQNNYPKFSITSDDGNGNNENEDNNQINNNYPKFSITSQENDGKDNNENNNIMNNNINEESNIKNKENNNFEKNNNRKIFNRNININSSKNNVFEPENKETININNSTQSNLIFNPAPPINYNYHLDDNEEEENHNKCVLLLSLIRKPQILKLFIVLLLTMGSMISNVNNIKFIVSSISSDHSLSSTSLDKYPLIYFAFNSISRVMAGGLLTNLMGTEYTFSALQVITFVGLWSQFLGIFMTKFTIYSSIAFAGITHGSLMTFIPLYCRYYYNVNDLGTVLGFLTTGNAFGSIIIATLIFPHYYHKYSYYDKYNNEICVGKKCFRSSYGINCLFMVIAFLISDWIFREDRKKKIQERKEREEMYRTVAFCSSNPRVSMGSDNSNQGIN